MKTFNLGHQAGFWVERLADKEVITRKELKAYEKRIDKLVDSDDRLGMAELHSHIKALWAKAKVKK